MMMVLHDWESLTSKTFQPTIPQRKNSKLLCIRLAAQLGPASRQPSPRTCCNHRFQAKRSCSAYLNELSRLVRRLPACISFENVGKLEAVPELEAIGTADGVAWATGSDVEVFCVV